MNDDELKVLEILIENFLKYNEGFHQKYVLGLEKNDSVTDEVLLLASLNPDERVLTFVMEGSKFPKNLVSGTVQKFNGTYFDVLFKSDKKEQIIEEVRKRVSYYKSLFKKDKKHSIFTQVSILWHSYMPCYDIENITSNKVSISPTFYVRLFRCKSFARCFLDLHFKFVLFWQKEYQRKSLA
jgi:hypothetical protein